MSLSILKQLITKQSSSQRYSGEFCNLSHFLFGKLAMSLRPKHRKAYLTLLLTSLLLSIDGSGIKNNQVAIAQTTLPSDSCPAIPGGIPPEPDAISWTDGNYSLYTIGNNSNAQGSQESGFAQAVANRGGTLTTLNSSNDFSFTGATGPGSAAASVGTFNNGTLSFSTNYTTTNRAEFRTTTFDAFVSGSSGDSVYIFPEQGGSAGDFYTVSIDFTNPVEAFSFDLVDIFDTLPDNNPVIRYEVYADGQLIAYFRGPFLGDDQVGNTDLFDGSGTLMGSVPTGQNLENTIGFLTDVPVSNVSIRHVIESGTVLSTARDPHGFDYFSYSISLPECVPDRSDAPTSYGTPAHVIASGTQLGAIGPDEDAADQPTTAANGDDSDGTDDEDGVLLGGSDLQGQSLTAGSSVTLDLTTQGSGVLNAWFDWNGDGDFDETDEQVATNVAPSGGAIALNVTVPAGATVGDTYARFRFSSDTDLAPSGTASDGEVEDYQVAIQSPPISSGPTFTCDPSFYVVVGNRSPRGSQLNRVNRNNTPYTFDPIGSQTTTASGGYATNFTYNALAYNPVDNYIYGTVIFSDDNASSLGNSNIIRIDANGNVTSLGRPAPAGGLSTNEVPITPGSYVAATILGDGTYVLYSDADRSVWTITGLETDTPVSTYRGQFPSTVEFPDFATNPQDTTANRVYGVDGGSNRLVYFDATNPAAGLSNATPNATGVNVNYGSQFYDAFGSLHFRTRDGNHELYKVDPDTGIASIVAPAPDGNQHDGTSCLGVGLTKDINTTTPVPAGDIVTYTYLIANGRTSPVTTTFSDDLRSVTDYVNSPDIESDTPVDGTFQTATVSIVDDDTDTPNGTGTPTFSNSDQTIAIDGLVLPPGSITRVEIDVQVPPDAVTPETYYNQATLTNLPPDLPAIVLSDYPTTPQFEDPTPVLVEQPISTNPDVVLVERITAINGNRTQNPNDNTPLNAPINDGIANSADDQSNWPASYLIGAIDGGLVKPGDEIERTVYFLNAGSSDAASVRICDWIQPYESFLTGVYGGNDIELVVGSTTYQLTAASDATDRAELATIGGLPAGPTCNLPAAATNATNEVLVLDITGTTGDPTGLATLPGTTGQGTPTNAYGYFRFTTKVDE